MLKNLMKKHRDIGLLDDPQFDKARGRHDWRNYIPDELRESWRELCFESRVAVFVATEKLANQENWD
jgi:hypothetical protein